MNRAGVEYEIERIFRPRLHGPETRDRDAYRCGHPQGPVRCRRLIACHECPFAELVEIEPMLIF